MKIAYCLTWDFGNADGVERKVFDQVSVWKSAGHEVTVFVVGSQAPYREWSVAVKPINVHSGPSFLRRIREWSELVDQVESFNPDVVYFRNQTWYPPFSRILKKFPVVAELNSMDLQNAEVLAQVNLKQKLRRPYFLATRGIVFKGVRGMVGVTSEMTHCSQYAPFKKPMISIANTISLKDYEVLPPSGNKRPKLILVGTGGKRRADQHWQGVDKVAEFAEQTQGILDFAVVGNGLAEGVPLPANVEAHGWQDLAGLQRLYSEADVAFGTVADYRRGMGETSSLKSRQALAFGLPILYGGNEAMFADYEGDIPEWALQLPNMADNLLANRDQIIAFANEWMGKRVPHAASREFIEAEVLERKRLAFMAEVAGV